MPSRTRSAAAPRSPRGERARPPADAGAGGGQQQRGAPRPSAVVLAEHEVARPGRPRRPGPYATPTGLRVSAARRSSTRTSPTMDSARPDQHAGRGPGAAGTSPVPADQQHRREVLQQQRHADREVLHGAEVAELGAGRRPRRRRPPSGRTGGAAGQPDAAQQQQAGHEQHQERAARSGRRPPPPATSRASSSERAERARTGRTTRPSRGPMTSPARRSVARPVRGGWWLIGGRPVAISRRRSVLSLPNRITLLTLREPCCQESRCISLMTREVALVRGRRAGQHPAATGSTSSPTRAGLDAFLERFPMSGGAPAHRRGAGSGPRGARAAAAACGPRRPGRAAADRQRASCARPTPSPTWPSTTSSTGTCT